VARHTARQEGDTGCYASQLRRHEMLRRAYITMHVVVDVAGCHYITPAYEEIRFTAEDWLLPALRGDAIRQPATCRYHTGAMARY